MPTKKSFLRTPFVSALIGGAIVAVFGWIAIAAGWIQSEGGSTTTVAQPLTAPVSSKDSRDEANVVNQIYKADGNGVAFIESEIPAEETGISPFGEPESSGGGTATGSGFVIDGAGHVLTNNHVIEGANQVTVKLGESNRTYTAEVVGADPGSDLALLKVDAPASELHPLTLGHSADVEVGDPVVAIGNPFGLDRTVTSGIVSALQRQIQSPNGFSIDDVIQTDAAINPGNSGGPLINAEGEVIGINSQIETGGGGNGNVGIGFAIPIDTAREEIQELESKGEVEHAFLGISGGSITPTLAKALNLPVSEGVIVQSVVKDGPADEAGIEGGNTSATIGGAEVSLGGDIITEIDGRKISGMDELIELVGKAKPGEEMELTILRSGDERTAHVTLGHQPESAGAEASKPE
ncbi:MAG TPA: trypsin-like peptidase domain-containing protein [Solirubrobacterales bacterium]|jgi:S1-C subfamily serine protease|nr:trypsin-like peptidase domain-containing protein [Solirubrobacterales bacterium]